MFSRGSQFNLREIASPFHTHALELSLKQGLIIYLRFTGKEKTSYTFLYSEDPTNQGIIECQKQEGTLRISLVYPLKVPIGAIILLKHREGKF